MPLKQKWQQSLVLLFTLRISMFLLPLAFTTLSVTKSHAGSMKVMCAVLVGGLLWLHRCCRLNPFCSVLVLLPSFLFIVLMNKYFFLSTSLHLKR